MRGNSCRHRSPRQALRVRVISLSCAGRATGYGYTWPSRHRCPASPVTRKPTGTDGRQTRRDQAGQRDEDPWWWAWCMALIARAI